MQSPSASLPAPRPRCDRNVVIQVDLLHGRRPDVLLQGGVRSVIHLTDQQARAVLDVHQVDAASFLLEAPQVIEGGAEGMQEDDSVGASMRDDEEVFPAGSRQDSSKRGEDAILERTEAFAAQEPGLSRRDTR